MLYFILFMLQCRYDSALYKMHFTSFHIITFKTVFVLFSAIPVKKIDDYWI